MQRIKNINIPTLGCNFCTEMKKLRESVFAPAKSALFSSEMHIHGPVAQLSHRAFLIKSTMLIARSTLTGPRSRLTCCYAPVSIPLQSCNRRKMRKSGRCAGWMGQGEETGNSARNLDVALLPLTQRLLLRASENSQTGMHRSTKITDEKQYGRYTDANFRDCDVKRFLFYTFALVNNH